MTSWRKRRIAGSSHPVTLRLQLSLLISACGAMLAYNRLYFILLEDEMAFSHNI